MKSCCRPISGSARPWQLLFSVAAVSLLAWIFWLASSKGKDPKPSGRGEGAQVNHAPKNDPSRPGGALVRSPQNGVSENSSNWETHLQRLRGEAPEREWPDALAHLEEALLENSPGLADALTRTAMDSSKPETLRILALLLIGRSHPTRIANECLGLLETSQGKVAVGAAYAFVLPAGDRKMSKSSRHDFWTGLLAGFDIGEVVAPGFRTRLANEIAGLPPESDPSSSLEAAPIPFDAYQPGKVADPRVEFRIIALLRSSRDASITDPLLFTLRGDSGSVEQLIKEIAIDPTYSATTRQRAISLFGKEDSNYLYICFSLERDEQVRNQIAKAISQTDQSHQLADALAREIKRGESNNTTIATLAKGVVRSGRVDGISYLIQSIHETQDAQTRSILIASLSERSLPGSQEAERIKEDTLSRLIRDQDPGIRGVAIQYFYQAKGDSAIPEISLLAQSDPDPAVRDRARLIIEGHKPRK